MTRILFLVVALAGCSGVPEDDKPREEADADTDTDVDVDACSVTDAVCATGTCV